GVASLAKVVLSLVNRTIPPSLHFTTPNPLIEWDRYPIEVPTGALPWQSESGPLRAGVSSFGFSGTNCHLILESAPDRVVVPPDPDRSRRLLVLTVKTETAVEELAARYLDWLDGPDAPSLPDTAATAALGRNHFSERIAVVAGSTAEARTRLAGVLAGETD